MQKPILSFVLFVCSFCFAQQNTEIDTMLQKWHKAAADADFESYFSHMTKDAIFIGTDPTENWNYSDFKAFSKPYFDKGKAWSFSTLKRNVFAEKDANIAWFDELLDTQMGICRGSGVVYKTAEGWKVKHYVLSIAIPNDNVKEITKIKTKFDTALIKKLKTTQKN